MCPSVAAAMGAYEDSPEIYDGLMASFAETMDAVVADQAHLMFRFPIAKYQWTYDALSAMGWKVDPHPLIWHKSDNTGHRQGHPRGFERVDNFNLATQSEIGESGVEAGNCNRAHVTTFLGICHKDYAPLRRAPNGALLMRCGRRIAPVTPGF